MAHIILDTIPYRHCKDIASRFLSLHEQHPQFYPHFLLSTTRGSGARYSILFAHPLQTLSLNHDGTLHGSDDKHDDDFLKNFEHLWRKEASLQNSSLNSPFPFHGGWFFFLSYEYTQMLEPRLNLTMPHLPIPLAEATRIPAAIIHDNRSGVIYAFAEDGMKDDLQKMQEDWNDSQQHEFSISQEQPLIRYDDIEEEPAEQHLEGIARCIDYIHAGDVFQINLSRAWQAQLQHATHHGDLFLRLAQCNPAPFAAFATWGDAAIISSSPERLISIDNGIIETRPIAGTRPRGASAMIDIALQHELKDNPKERAEHIMLVDLERNDISRVCVAGSVNVRDLMTIESYAHVHHIVSVINGRLKANATPQDALKAVFPGGTITGCPKIRCMEILSEIETKPRHGYTGSLGYINHDGSMDCNILIRTMMRHRQTIEFRAGGGIVADSKPEQELQETRSKAQGLIRALCGDLSHQVAMTPI